VNSNAHFVKKYKSIFQIYTQVVNKEKLGRWKTKSELRGFSPQENYTDRATAACGQLMLTLADRGCRVVSATDPHGR
jgi:hypothetical protein